MSEPYVTIEQGKLHGRVGQHYKGDKFYIFQGIPYAKPPVGELRFKAPQPPEPWDGVREAITESSESLAKHMIFFHNVGAEDCLYLNVFTPKLPTETDKALKPVMVWIHGGGFVTGSSKEEVYNPEYLLSQDIVLVTINYRLAILGFLSLEDTSLGVPGNAGLKDMVLALKWVQQNIEQFGGDRSNVTIFGESAGAAAVHYLMLSPTAKGLFHRAIMQSGCTLNPWAAGDRVAVKIAKALGYESENEKDILNFLKSVPAEKFLEAQDIIKDSMTMDTLRPFGPVIEKPNDEAFITEHPLDIMLSGNYIKVPIIIGYNTREGMILALIQTKDYGKIVYPFDDFEKIIPHHYNIPKRTELSRNVAKSIKEYYYGQAEATVDDVDKYYVLESDTQFLRGIHTTIRALLTTTDQPIYLYRFAVESTLNIYKGLANITDPGVCHADELGYLFNTVINPAFEENSLEGKTVHRIIKLWSTFARNGDPNPKDKDPLLDVVWPPVTSSQLKHLEIGETLSIGTNVAKKMMDFWDSLSATEGINSKL
ncbi:uncharacterized protein CBL_08230 [Carabus blaptoides fortunei]